MKLVKIKDADGSYIGGGVVIQPESDDYSYIFTAKHCLQDKIGNNRNIQIFDEEDSSIQYQQIIIPEDENIDIAIFVISKEIEEPTNFITDVGVNSTITLWFFSPIDEVMHKIPANFSGFHENFFDIYTSTDMDSQNFQNIDEKSHGLSGSPIILENRLIGIFLKKKGKLLAQDFTCAGIQIFNNLLEANKLTQIEKRNVVIDQRDHLISSINPSEYLETNVPAFSKDIKQESNFESGKIPFNSTSSVKAHLNFKEYGISISKAENLEEIWLERKYYLRDSHNRGVSNLSEFWTNQCCDEIWNKTPGEFLTSDFIDEYDLIIISGESGSGKTMFLLSLAKQLLEQSPEKSLKFLRIDQILNKMLMESLKNSIIFLDLPSFNEEQIILLEQILKNANQQKNTLIISQYPGIAAKINAYLEKNANLRCKNIPISKNFHSNLDPIKQLIGKLITSWNIQLETRNNLHSMTEAIIQHIKSNNIRQILLFCTTNLARFKNSTKILSESEIEKFTEPLQYSTNYIKKNVEDRPSFLLACSTLIEYMNWLKIEYSKLKFDSFLITVSIEGIIKTVADYFHITNLGEVLRESMIFDSIGNDLAYFNPEGFGNRVIQEISPNIIQNPSKVKKYKKKLIKDILSWEKQIIRCQDVSVGQLLDYFKIAVVERLDSRWIRQVRLFLKENVNNPVNKARIKKLISLFMNFGIVFHGSNEKLAKEFYNLVLTVDDSYTDALVNLSAFYLESDKCLEYINKILEKHPQNLSAHHNLGYYHMVKGDFNKAKKIFEDLLSSDPDHKFALSNLLRISITNRNFTQADQCFQKLISLSEISEGFQLEYASFLLRNDRIDEAEILIHQLQSTISPSDPLYIELKMLELQKISVIEDFQAMEEILSTLLKSFPENFRLNFAYGNLKFHLNQFRLAEKHLLKSVNKNEKDDFFVNLYLYELYEAWGKRWKANRYKKKILKHSSNNSIEIIDHALSAFAIGAKSLCEELLQKAYSTNPESSETNHHYGGFLLRHGNKPRGLELLISAVSLDPENIQSRFELIDYYFNHNNHVLALKLINEVLQLGKAQKRAKIYQIWILKEEEKYDEALGILLHLKDEFPEDIEIINHLGQVCFFLNDFNHAEDYMRQTLAINPTHYESIVSLGITLLMKKDYPKADLQFQEALKLKPSGDFRLHVYYAHLYFEQGDFDNSLKSYKKALIFDPNNMGALVNSSAILLHTKNNLETAKERLEHAYNLNPNSFEVIYNLARVLSALGLNECAERMFITGCDHFPEEPRILASYGEFKAELGSKEEAEILLLQAIKLDEKSMFVLEHLVNFFEKQENYQPYNKETYFYLGLYHYRKGHLSEAERYYKKCITEIEEHFEANLALSLLYVNKSEFQKVRSLIMKIRENPKALTNHKFHICYLYSYIDDPSDEQYQLSFNFVLSNHALYIYQTLLVLGLYLHDAKCYKFSFDILFTLTQRSLDTKTERIINTFYIRELGKLGGEKWKFPEFLPTIIFAVILGESEVFENFVKDFCHDRDVPKEWSGRIQKLIQQEKIPED
jgi:tetratricopeptide (TPR) repeat protein